MVAITTLTAYSPSLHTGGSAAQHSAPPRADKGERSDAPATIVTLSDQAQMLVAEAKAAQAVGDIFAIANGMAQSQDAAGAQGAKPQVIVAHDVQTNEGLYILWSSTR